MRRAPVASLIIACCTVSGCRASASADASLKTPAGEETEKFDSPASVQTGPTNPASADMALLGARHDLRLAKSGTAVCSCLAAALGAPDEPAFAWGSVVPRIDPQNQVVIALSSDGLACPGASKDSLGASYWGYKQNGNDVFVIVEALKPGRPLTAGAIIPKPIENGQVYVLPRARSVPYGRPLIASDRVCKLGNPGPRRGPAGAAPESEQDDSFESAPE
jgi:hypothetical protein